MNSLLKKSKARKFYTIKKLLKVYKVKILGEMIEKFLKVLVLAKVCAGVQSFEFIRAIRSIACILNDELVNFQSYGVKVLKTFIHRSVSYDLQDFNNAKEYFELLEKTILSLIQSKEKKKYLSNLNS